MRAYVPIYHRPVGHTYPAAAGTDLELVSISLVTSVGYFPSCRLEQNRYSGLLTRRTYPHCRSGCERGRTEEASHGALVAARPFLDAIVYMSLHLVERGIYPAVEPGRSWSRLLDPAFVGPDHWKVAQGVLEALGRVADPGAKGGSFVNSYI